jgi:hypothetical protein
MSDTKELGVNEEELLKSGQKTDQEKNEYKSFEGIDENGKAYYGRKFKIPNWMEESFRDTLHPKS